MHPHLYELDQVNVTMQQYHRDALRAEQIRTAGGGHPISVLAFLTRLAVPLRPAVHPVFRHAGMALGTALSRLSTLPHDSRDSLPLKETELASFGVSWVTDLAHETELAQELATARLRRAGVNVAPGSPPLSVAPEPETGSVSPPALAAPAAAMGVS